MNMLLCFFMVILASLPINLNLNLNLIEAKNVGFSIEIIHRDSPLSPFYNHSLTPAEVSINAALRSIARLTHFHDSSFTRHDRKAIESTVISDPDVGDYLMKISIGTPPVEVLAIADTGSDLIWTQCKPCDQCYPQNSPIFDPLKSSSYQLLSCNSKPCSWLPIQSCNINATNKCQYLYSYQDNSITQGDLATETLTFRTSSTNNNSQLQAVFGCGHNNGGIFSNLTAGLVGLGGGPLSLISQLGSQIQYKFSYCLVPQNSSSTSKIRFSVDAVLLSGGGGIASTPLVSKPNSTFYYITLEGISIGNKTVPAAAVPVAAGNIIIDSGTSLTSLETSFYNNFEGVVKEVLVGLQPVQDPSGTHNLCYDAAATAKLPDMVFHFTAGADITLKPLNTFLEIEYLVCLTITSSDGGLSIFGNLAQVNFQVEYDLEGRSFFSLLLTAPLSSPGS